MRILTTSLLAVALGAALPAQARDWAGIMVRADGVTPAVNSVATFPPCGSPFSCTPLTLSAQLGDTVQFFVMGTFNGVYILAASLDFRTPVCLPLGIPGIANDLILTPGTIVTLSVGQCTVPDNGRCNGGASPLTPLFTFPPGLQPGVMGIQGLVASPLSAGGTGFAFTRAVAIRYQ